MITTITRYVLGLLGLTLLYLAFFITVDEEGKIGNRLEELWKRVRTSQSAAMSRQAAFLQTIAEAFHSTIESWFGAQIFSLQFIAVAVVLCALPHILFFLFEPAHLVVKIVLVLGIISVGLKASNEPTVGGIFITIILSLCPAIYRSWSSGRLAPLITPFPGLDGTSALLEISKILFQVVLLPVFAAFIVGVLGILLFVTLNDFLLRRSSVATGSPFMLLLVLVTNVMLAAVYLAPLFGPELLLERAFAGGASSPSDKTPFIFKLMVFNPDHPFWYEVWVGIRFLSVLVVLPALITMLIVLLIVMMVVHRLVWPFIWRPLYAAHYHRLFRQHTLLGAIGAYCLWKAWPTGAVSQFLHKLLPLGH